MNALLSALCAIAAVVIVTGGFLYATYYAIVAVFGEGESGQAMVWTAACIIGFYCLMAVASRFNDNSTS